MALGRGRADRGTLVRDVHLRSTNDVSGHHIRAADQDMGRVDDFLIEGETWAMSPRWIERIGWSESTVYFNLTRETIKRSEYSERPALIRDYETALQRYYDLQGYWVLESPAVQAAISGSGRAAD